ncbi:MAG: MFS transporter [Limnochordia bacterium]|jgi:MFS family permease
MSAQVGRKKLRPAMRIVALEGLFASASDYFAVPYVSLFALSLGASRTQIGLIAAVTALLGSVMQLPIAVMTEGRWSRKKWFLLSGLLARGLFIPMALLPLFASGQRAVWLFVSLVAIRSLGTALGLPVWTTLVADITPQEVRGRFFAYRNMLMNSAGLVSVLLAGWLIRQWGAPQGYQISFLAAATMGLISVAAFSRLEEPAVQAPVKPSAPEIRLPLRRRVALVVNHLRDERQFSVYAATSIVWTLGLALPQPLFALYFVEQLGGADYLWGLLSATTTVVTVIGQRYWGPLADSVGAQRIMGMAGIGAMSVPLFYLLVPDYRFVYAFNAVTAFAWAGYNLGAFNLLLEITPGTRKTTYVAGYNGLVGMATTVASLTGGFLAESVGIRTTFLLSFLLRMLGWLLFIALVRPTGGSSAEWPRLITKRRKKHRS